MTQHNEDPSHAEESQSTSDLAGEDTSNSQDASMFKDLAQQDASREQAFLEGRLAAVDYGTVRIGIAICDPDRILASPLQVIDRRQVTHLADEFQTIATEEKIVGWVVGLPVHLDGGESQKSLEARRFAAWIQSETQLPVRLFDERFSTASANERMMPSGFTRKKHKARVDAVAAQVLLESFIEALAGGSGIPGFAVNSLPKGDQSIDS